MNFTALYAVPTLLALVVIFGLAYKIKGMKTALLAAGAALILAAVVFIASIYMITASM